MVSILVSRSEPLTIWTSTNASSPAGRCGRPENRMTRACGSTALISWAVAHPSYPVAHSQRSQWEMFRSNQLERSRARFAILTRNPRYSSIAARTIRWSVACRLQDARESLVMSSSRVTKHALYRVFTNHQAPSSRATTRCLFNEIRLFSAVCALCEARRP